MSYQEIFESYRLILALSMSIPMLLLLYAGLVYLLDKNPQVRQNISRMAIMLGGLLAGMFVSVACAYMITSLIRVH